MHSKGGIIIDHGSVPTIENNVLLDNDIGMTVSHSEAVIQHNFIAAPLGSPHHFTYRGNPIYRAWPADDKYTWIMGINVVGSSPTIINNIISDVPMGVVSRGISSPDVSYNTIINSGNAVQFESDSVGTPKTYMNNMYNNSTNIVQTASYPVDASNNWWGTTNIEEIGHKIHDYNDNQALGEVNYQPFLEGIVKHGSLITLSTTISSTTLGEPVKVLGFIGPPHGWVAVTLTYTKPDSVVVTEALTADFTGRFSDTYFPEQVGVWSVQASWLGSEHQEGAMSAPVEFRIN
jgi:hypothetical protein